MNSKIYFVLYIILVCEVFIVIRDRDDAIDELSSHLIKGRGSDFNLVAPDSVLNVQVFANNMGDLAQSDSIKCIVLANTFSKYDSIVILPQWVWQIKPKYFAGGVNCDIKPVLKDSLKDNYIFVVSYSGKKLTNNGEKLRDTSKIIITCKIFRPLETGQLFSNKRKSINNKEFIELNSENCTEMEGDSTIFSNGKKYYQREIQISDDNKKFIPLLGKCEITIVFKQSYLKIPDIAIRNTNRTR